LRYKATEKFNRLYISTRSSQLSYSRINGAGGGIRTPQPRPSNGMKSMLQTALLL